MLQAMCGGDEECMLEVWRSCKEQPKCVESLYNERMAEEKEKAAAAGAKKAQVLFCLILLLLVVLLQTTFPTNSPSCVLQTSCSLRLPQCLPLMDSPDPDKTQSTAGTVLSIHTAPHQPGPGPKCNSLDL